MTGYPVMPYSKNAMHLYLDLVVHCFLSVQLRDSSRLVSSPRLFASYLLQTFDL
jgi:hypothetical protein